MFPEPEEIIDLSNPIDHDIPVWPSFPALELTRTAWAARDGYTMERVEMRTHTATHIDSPRHFIPEGKTLDDFPVSKFMGEGVAVDLTPKEPEEPITADDVEQYADRIEDGDVVMLHTNWHDHYGLTPEYLFEFPYLTREAAEALADLNPKAVGTEGASVGGWYGEVDAHGPSTDVHPADSHLPLLENDIIPIEEVRNLDRVLDGADARRAYFFYPPLNFQGTSGSSVRCFAFL
jgi:kynurenine formamidase